MSVPKTATMLTSAGLAVALLSAVIGYICSSLDNHRNLTGHPPMIERVKAVREDVAELKAGQANMYQQLQNVHIDVQELLRRTP